MGLHHDRSAKQMNTQGVVRESLHGQETHKGLHTLMLAALSFEEDTPMISLSALHVGTTLKSEHGEAKSQILGPSASRYQKQKSYMFKFLLFLTFSGVRGRHRPLEGQQSARKLRMVTVRLAGRVFAAMNSTSLIPSVERRNAYPVWLGNTSAWVSWMVSKRHSFG